MIVNPVGMMNLVIYLFIEKTTVFLSIINLIACAIKNTTQRIINEDSTCAPNLYDTYAIGKHNRVKPSTNKWYCLTLPAACTMVVIGLPNIRMREYININLVKDTIYTPTDPSHI